MPTNPSPSVTPGKTNLQVGEGKSILVSPDSGEFKASYQQIRPTSIDQVREILGMPAPAASAVKAAVPAAPRFTAAVVPVEHLQSTQVALRINARTLTQQAASEYVRSADVSHLTAWKPVIDQYLQLSKAVLNIVAFADIDIAKGATLTISKKTHALYANHVRIHGNGRIVCQGGMKFKFNSLQGIK